MICPVRLSTAATLYCAAIVCAASAAAQSTQGALQNASNQPITIDGLWGLSFGDGGNAGSAMALYFSAGSNHEQDGPFGMISAVENVQGNDQ